MNKWFWVVMLMWGCGSQQEKPLPSLCQQVLVDLGAFCSNPKSLMTVAKYGCESNITYPVAMKNEMEGKSDSERESICQRYAKNHTETYKTLTIPQAPKPPPAPIPVVTAKTLLDEYQENELAADKKYKGKRIEVTGAVHEVGRRSGRVYVAMRDATNPGFKEIYCYMATILEDQAEPLKKGQPIKMRGDVTGKGIFSAELENCIIAH